VSHNHQSTNRATPLIKGWKELFTKVSDEQSLLQSLKDSPYFGPFADQCSQVGHFTFPLAICKELTELSFQFESRLSILDECLHHLNNIQRKWVYLEPIFGRGGLPQEQVWRISEILLDKQCPLTFLLA
jgi:dynein heavy chain 2